MSNATPAAGGGQREPHLTVIQQTRPLVCDRLHFDQPSERMVYEALRREQEQRDRHDTLAIASSVSIRVPKHTFKADLLVACGGKVAVIEVDGAVHGRKYSSDRSRDELLRDAGFHYVYRIDAEDTEDPRCIDDHVRRCLKRLE